MHIRRVKITGYKLFRDFDLELNDNLNVIVGDNETGKTTLLEAINLVMSCQLDGRSIQYGLHPFLFNKEMVEDYFTAVRKAQRKDPPCIRIEAYIDGDASSELARLRGTNNSEGQDCSGLYLRVELNEDFTDEFLDYVRMPDNPVILPTEYYTVVWRSFAYNSVVAKNLPFQAKIIDTSLSRGFPGPSKYLSRIISDVLGKDQQLLLSVAYRNLKHAFLEEKSIASINEYLESKKGDVSARRLTVSMDMSARSTWDSSITAHLDDIPFDLVGKGEQCCVQMKLAVEDAGGSNVLLIEEPENHLSHSRMCGLLGEIVEKGADRQIVVATHSSFVLNKLGVSHVKLLSASASTTTLADLPDDTRDFFRKLPGYDTLRLLLSRKAILVEGPSDELVVQRAYRDTHHKLPLDDGVDVISVGTSFLRFLEIGRRLDLAITVVTDNDGDVGALKRKYKAYLGGQTRSIRICFDDDEDCKTLEPQLVKANTLQKLNAVLRTSHAGKKALRHYMSKNKTECALRVFTSDKTLEYPRYIRHAID